MNIRKDTQDSTAGSVAKVVIAVFIIIFVIVFNQQIIKYLLAGLETYTELPNHSEFIIDRHITLDVEGADIDANLTIPWPEDIEYRDAEGNVHIIQDVISVNAVPKWTRKTTEPGTGTTMMLWHQHIAAGSKIEIVVTYHVKAYSTVWDINTGNSATIDDIPSEIYNRYYMRDEWPLESDEMAKWGGLKYRIAPTNETIKNLAEYLTKDKPTVYTKLKAIYDYLDDNFKYERGTEGLPKNCIQTLAEKSGDCDDQSILFISLCRAIGIPAWLEAGALYDPNSDYDPNGDGLSDEWEGHAWANVYIPLTNGDYKIATVDVVNNLFLKRDTNRFSEWMDNGDSDRVMEYYTLWDYTYTPGGPHGGTPKVTTGEYFITQEFQSTGNKETVLRI